MRLLAYWSLSPHYAVRGISQATGDVLSHTHAFVMLTQGVHPNMVQERLEYARIGTTLDVYPHVIPSFQKEASDRYDLALEPVE